MNNTCKILLIENSKIINIIDLGFTKTEEVQKDVPNFKYIPRVNEFIFFDEKYFTVTNVMYNINDNEISLFLKEITKNYIEFINK